uniref:Uncharacterized protein n=1 Tax=uncultured marine virus TaxID=186617 RepID=A0A0F7L873_9VIRU|nr:hypothetical protein [uncultured marine virus]
MELQSDKPTLHKLVCRYPESVLIYITYVLGFFNTCISTNCLKVATSRTAKQWVKVLVNC